MSPRKGYKLSAETRAKMSAARKGVPLSPEHRRKISEALTGKKHSEEAKRKMSAAKKGKPLPPEHRRHIAEAMQRPEVKAKCSKGMKGKKHSEQWKRKMSRALKGRPTPWLDEIRRRPRSAETRAKTARSIAALGDQHPMRQPEIKERCLKKSRATMAKNGGVSKGQRKLYEILDDLDIDFIPERFFRLGGNRSAFVDAYIPPPFNVAIEYDGHQGHTRQEGIIHDEKRDAAMLELYGIRTLRIRQKTIYTKYAASLIKTFLAPTSSNIARMAG